MTFGSHFLNSSERIVTCIHEVIFECHTKGTSSSTEHKKISEIEHFFVRDEDENREE